MNSIYGFGSLGSDQIRALNRLTQLSKDISTTTQRLSTGKRINSSKDDPSGVIEAALLQQELISAESSLQSITKANALISTADTAASEVVTQLQAARSLVLEAASGTLTSDGIASNQTQVDSILSSLDTLSRTSFNNQRLLDGSSGYRTTGINSAQIDDVDVLEKSASGNVSISINVSSVATQGTDSYTGGALGGDATLLITGPRGSTSISLSSGATTQDITDAYNGATYLTGISATRIDANQVDFATVDYGSDATVSIEATSGTFSTIGAVAGTDVVATVNGLSVSSSGTRLNVNTSEIAMVVELDAAATGALTTFDVTGDGLEFIVGTSANDTARIGLPTLTTASLGGVDGSLSTIVSGGTNTLTGGRAAEALRIIDDAILDATRGQAVIGAFQSYTLDSSSRVLEATIENVTESLSAVQDADLAVETSRLANQQLLQSTTLEALSISNLNGQNVLKLLSAITLRL